MKVLFVARGKLYEKASTIVANQAESLNDLNIEVSLFLIKRKGFIGYLKELIRLRKFLRTYFFNVIHTHYALSGYLATLAGAKPLVVSLMGSDVIRKKVTLLLLKYFIKRHWDLTIVKTKEMYDIISDRKVMIIPNGVNLNQFVPVKIALAKERLGLDHSKKYIFFGSDPERPEKNFGLVKEALDKLSQGNIELICLKNIPNRKVPDYLNSVEVVVLSSLREGSPNVIKEAMACNKPIVSTKVGDVEWLFEGVEGCFISDFNSNDYSNKLLQALSFSEIHNTTKGREKLISLGLDSKTVASKIIGIYNSIIHNK